MKRWWWKILLGTPLLLLLLVLGSGVFVLRTESGARWVLETAEGYLPGQLQYDRAEGNLASGLELQNPGFHAEGIMVQADRLRLAVLPEFFPLTLRIRFVELDGLRYTLPGEQEPASSDQPLESLALPLIVELERLQIDGIAILDPDQKSLFEASAFTAAGTFSDQAVIRNAILDSAYGQVRADGAISLQHPFPAELETSADLTIALENQDMPLLARLQGHLAGQKGTYEFIAQGSASFGDFELEGDGRVDLADGVVDGALDWQSFSWPLNSAEPDLSSRSGKVRIGGTLDAWQVAGEAELESPGLTAGRLSFDASGDREQLQAEILEGQVLGGSLSGQAAYSWGEKGTFDVRLNTKSLSLEAFYPDVPVVVSGGFAAQGRIEPFSIELDIDRLSSEVRGHDIAVSGRASYQPGRLHFTDLLAQSGESKLLLDGQLETAEGLAFSADINDLGQFVPQGAGVLNMQGRVSNLKGQPGLNIVMQGKDLAWNDIRLPVVTIADMETTRPDRVAAFRVELTDPFVGANYLDSATLDFDLGRSGQTLAVTAARNTHTVELGAEGRIQNPDAKPGDWRWVGDLSRLALLSAEEAILSLEEPAELQVSAAQAELAPSCLLTPPDSRFCLQGTWKSGSGVEAGVKLENIGFDLLERFVPEDIEFTQVAAGELQIGLDQAGIPSMLADFNLTPGVIRYRDDEEPILETGEGVAGFRLQDGAVTAGNFDLPLPGQGEVDLDFEISDVDGGLDSPLAGRLRVDLDDLDILSVFLPMVNEIGGRLDADLLVAGTALKPEFSGYLDLADGLLLHRASGLRISDVQLAGKLDPKRQTRLEGSFRAAEGQGQLEAIIDMVDVLSPRVELKITGSDLKLFDAEDLMIVAEPDIQVAWQAGEISIGGSLAVPRALVAPTVIPSATVNESPDLVITAGGDAVERDSEEGSARLTIHGSLDVSLGDDVKLDLSVAKADVRGRVKFAWQGDVMPVAKGALNVSGEILAFGQLLEISRGTIGFPDVPANNPHLNIQAERQIYGNSEIRRAGLLVAGTVRRPVIEPYTDPRTNRERAQTLLVTGSDFNMERGVGAVNIGTYIAPRIFVSYGVGVFGDENAISIRYDLARGWGVQATSGESQTGVDLSYTIDN